MSEDLKDGLLAEDLTEVDWTALIADAVGDNLDDLDVLEIQACGCSTFCISSGGEMTVSFGCL